MAKRKKAAIGRPILSAQQQYQTSLWQSFSSSFKTEAENRFDDQSPRHARQSRITHRPQDRWSPAPVHPNGFTLQDEARYTSSAHSPLVQESKLRHNRVLFISAGALDPEKIEDASNTQSDHDPSTLPSPSDQEDGAFQSLKPSGDVMVADSDCRFRNPTSGLPLPRPSQSIGLESVERAPEVSSFTFDITSSLPAVETALPNTLLRAPSPTPSNSSEELVVYTGRKNRVDLRVKQSNQPPCGQSSASPNAWRDNAGNAPKTVASQSAFSTIPQMPNSSTRHGFAILEDPQVLIKGIGDSSYMARERGERGADRVVSSQTAQRGQNNVQTPVQLADGVSAIRERDSASELDLIPDVENIQNRIWGMDVGQNAQGDGYVRPEGSDSVKEAWGAISTPEDLQAAEDSQGLLSEKFEDTDSISAMGASGEDSDGDSADEDMDDEGILAERMSVLTDEQIARLLSKQEELGMGSADLLLFDDSEGQQRKHQLLPPGQNFRSPWAMTDDLTTLKHNPRGGNGVHSGDFDVMDWARPSLQNARKGRKHGPPMQISDSELEETAQKSWGKDRDKKKARKQQREDLRAQGMLKKGKSGKPNINEKYQERMTRSQLKDEIRSFVYSDLQTLELPVMEKKDRKIVHQIAHAFILKSQSLGSPSSRYTTLFKTPRTRQFIEDNLDKMTSRSGQRGFLRRGEQKAKNGSAEVSRRLPGSSSRAATYRDGEIVGAAAPELGAENRGRAMMERMGWSSGTALGALNNKGILQPVAHVVKTSKAGLG